MNELFAEARAKGLWFFTGYQHLWFSPDELATEQANGRFRWGPENWKLRDPAEHLAELDRKMVEAQRQRDEFFIRMEKAKP